MGVSQSFPAEQEISEAYNAVLFSNQVAERDAQMLEAMEAQFAPPSEEILSQFDDLEQEAPIEQENERLAAMDSRYRGLFDAIGLALDTSSLPSVGTNSRLGITECIVPELVRPRKFTAYLGYIGCEAVYGDPVHRQLAEDVVSHMHSVVFNLENMITLLQRAQQVSPDADNYIKSFRAEYLQKFSQISSYYRRANFHTFMPAYALLQKRIPADPLSSL